MSSTRLCHCVHWSSILRYMKLIQSTGLSVRFKLLNAALLHNVTHFEVVLSIVNNSIQLSLLLKY